MKTMTCKDLGGTCDQKLSPESWNEMVCLTGLQAEPGEARQRSLRLSLRWDVRGITVRPEVVNSVTTL
jgi:hypothetical protein